ncbi:melanoma cell adhesion molecule b [Chanos chanos]|uniref:Melanoma cell adhesion molecule b n=1 Tax=Chanos chanos TaxID=29144 RepID=A0A6J2VNG6_CHACN|nr:cell surface glycoprotein MUC18-like [Chanos chanos]
MTLRKNLVVLAVFHILSWQAWAKVEVSMEDRVEVYQGDMVDIPCMYTLSQKSNDVVVQWFVKHTGNKKQIFYGDDHTETVEPDTSFHGRINVTHHLVGKKGTSILSIPEVQLSDERTFYCSIKASDLGSAEGHTRLLVFKSPEVPSIEPVYGGIPVSNLGHSKIATCKVNNGYPHPNITWYRDRTPLQQEDENVKVMERETIHPSGLISVESDLHLRVIKEYKDSKFYCEVSYFVPAGLKMTESDRINITVHYASTKVTLEKEYPKGLVKEGDNVTLRCRGDGNPQPPFTFTFKGEDIEAELDMLILANVTQLNNGTYQCKSLDVDTYEEFEDSMELVVNFLQPAEVRRISDDHSSVLLLGEDLELICTAFSTLPTRTVWSKDGKQIGEGDKLLMENGTYEMAGTYVCKVTVPSLPELQEQDSIQIDVHGSPDMVQPVMVISEDNAERSVNLSCYARGFPVPFINWTFSNPESFQAVSETLTETNVYSVVTVKAISDVNVSCIAFNSYGTISMSYSVSATQITTPVTTSTSTWTKAAGSPSSPKQKGKRGGSGVIIAVIIICILLLAVLGSVLYFLYKTGKISCGRSGKQDLTKVKPGKDDMVGEMKTDKSEETVLLQGINGDKKLSNDQ